MEPIAMLHADPLDILFENRNKSYGAYPLRKFYVQRMYISLGITLSVVSTLTLLYLNFNSLPPAVHIFDVPDPGLISVIIPPPEPLHPPIPRPPAMHPMASVQFVTPVIVNDPPVTTTLPPVSSLNTAQIGTQTIEGPADNGNIPSPGQSNGNAGTATQKTDSAESKPEIFDVAEVMPEFPGGIEAMKRFLLRNLRMPETENDPGTRIHVEARFVVGADGKVRDIEITRPAEEMFNKEVKRVILKMPDWKPGMQNHRHVSVYFNLPVNFETAE